VDTKHKVFLQFSSYRRNHKHVWEIKDDTGQTHSSQVELKAEASNYFKNLFKEHDQPSATEQVRVAGLFS
jgi:hypothetical protein